MFHEILLGLQFRVGVLNHQFVLHVATGRLDCVRVVEHVVVVVLFGLVASRAGACCSVALVSAGFSLGVHSVYEAQPHRSKALCRLFALVAVLTHLCK